MPRAAKKAAKLLTRSWDDDSFVSHHTWRADGSLVAFDDLQGKVSLVGKKATKTLAKLSPAAASVEGPCVVAGTQVKTNRQNHVVRALFRFHDQEEDLAPLVGADDEIDWVAIHPAGDAAVACVQPRFGAKGSSKLRLFRRGAAPRTLTIEKSGGTKGIFDAKGRLLVVTTRAVVAYGLDGKKARQWPAKLTPPLTTLSRAGSRVLAMDGMDHAAHVYDDQGEVAVWKDTETVTAALTWDGRYLLVVTGGSVDLVDVAKQKRVARMKENSFALRIAVGPNDEVAVPGPYTAVYQLHLPG